MNARRIAAPLIMAVAAAGAPALAVDDARSSFVGTWQGAGTMYATPYSKSGATSDTTTCAFAAGTTYLVCSQHNDSPFGPGDQLSVYVRKPDGYGFTRIDPRGTAYPVSVTVDGTAWTYFSVFDDGTQKVQVRTINTFPSANTESWRTEYSTDSGRRWKVMAEGTEHRVSAVPSPSPAP